MRSLSFVTVLLSCLLLGCAGGKNNDQVVPLEENPPFSIQSAYYQPWVAGVKNGGKGMHLGVVLADFTEEVQLGDLFFRERVVRVRQDPDNIDLFTGSFKEQKQRDVIMDGDVVKEAQNTPPVSFPFDLDDDEMVLSYSFRGESFFVLIDEVEKRPLLAYPEQGGQPNDHN